MNLHFQTRDTDRHKMIQAYFSFLILYRCNVVSTYAIRFEHFLYQWWNVFCASITTLCGSKSDLIPQWKDRKLSDYEKGFEYDEYSTPPIVLDRRFRMFHIVHIDSCLIVSWFFQRKNYFLIIEVSSEKWFSAKFYKGSPIWLRTAWFCTFYNNKMIWLQMITWFS